MKKSLNSRNRGFSSRFCLMIEGSGVVPLINGPDPGGPKIKGAGSATPEKLQFKFCLQLVIITICNFIIVFFSELTAF
jgi:hypothetical protein